MPDHHGLLPLWMNEGIAEFLGCRTCKDRPAAEVIPEVIDDKSMAAYEAAWIAYWKKM